MSAKNALNLLGDRLYTLPLVVLYLTDGCNSRCATCDIWRNPRRNMSMSMIDDIAHACRDLDIRWVVLSGGEAMQHPQWAEIGQRFQAEGVHVMLLTNGLLLKKQAHLLKSVNEIIVSLDGGTAATYAAIRGVDAFDLILEGIYAAREQGIPVTTRTTLQRANYHEIPQIIEAAITADVNSISFLTVDVSNTFAFGPRFEPQPSPLNKQGNLDSLPLFTGEGSGMGVFPPSALTHEDIPQFERVLTDIEQRFAPEFTNGRMAESPQKLRQMVTYFKAILGEARFIPPRCNAPHLSTVIEVDGTLRPCYFLPSWGKLDERGLGAAINDKGAVALRKAYRQKQRPECERCVCPLYKGVRSLVRM